jgi:hypothetical protein
MPKLQSMGATTGRAELWRFLLLRVIHDFGNNISGVLALSEHHLRHELPPEEITESFKLIRESAETTRQMLMTVGSLTDDENQVPEYVRVSEFLTSLLGQITRIAPRSLSVQLEKKPEDAVIEVVPSDLRLAFIGLVAADYFAFGNKSGAIRIGSVTDAGKVWLTYHSNRKLGSDLSEYAASFFGALNPPPDDLAWSEPPEDLTVRVGYSIAPGFS